MHDYMIRIGISFLNTTYEYEWRLIHFVGIWAIRLAQIGAH